MKLAFVFPGQGSQSVGMLDSFAENETVQNVLARANAALGEDLAGMIQAGPAEVLNLTVNTQPAMLTASVAMYEAWVAMGGKKPEIMAGHSLGEYSALTAAGVFSLEEAVKLVKFRASAMQEAVPVGVGAMAAVLGLTDEKVQEACDKAADLGVCEPVNFNSPGQVVIAGAKAAVEKACVEAKALGAKRGLLLPVSVPSHSSMLKPASDALRAKLAEVEMAEPTVDVVANIDVVAHKDVAEIREALAQQVSGAVQWVKTIKSFEEMGVTHIVEVGPGRVLNGLIKRIAPSIEVKNINSQESLNAVFEELK